MFQRFLLQLQRLLLLAVLLLEVFAQSDTPVMAGYDLVEYHNLQASQDGVVGKESISHRHTNGYLYYFSTQANKELFIQNPDKYLPKYGGFCAWGIAWEYEDDGWPWAANHMGPPCGPSDGWAILSDGRLYCSINRHYQEDFNHKQQEGIRFADDRWIEFYGSLNAGPQNNGCYAWNWQECFARSIHK
jgi:YHS domain-containing protein